MKCTLSFDKFFCANPKLKYDDIFKMSLEELLQLQQKFDEDQLNKCKRDARKHDIYRKVYLLFDELTRYVPEEILFRILDNISASSIYTETSIPKNHIKEYSSYYLIKEYNDGGCGFL